MSLRQSLTSLLLALGLLLPVAATATIVVRMETTFGDIDIWLRDDLYETDPADYGKMDSWLRSEANDWLNRFALGDDMTAEADRLNTVQNFLAYVLAGGYQGALIHRSVPGTLLQGGGYKYSQIDGRPVEFNKFPRIKNEYNLPNTRGTIAMAKLPGQPDSATSEWFINSGDNTEIFGPDSILNPDTGGFTVFGQVLGDGMDVVDAIEAIEPFNAGGAFSAIPLVDFLAGSIIQESNLVVVNDAYVILSSPGPGIPVKGASEFYSVLKFDPDDTVISVNAAPNPSPSDAPADVDFPEGFYEFSFDTTASETTVALLMPSNHPVNVYYKYGPTPDNSTPHWYNFNWDGRTGAKFYTERGLVVLTFRDGERGDDDLSINGTIVDVGGPGIGPGGPGPTGGNSGGGGGAIGFGMLALLGVFATRRHMKDVTDGLMR